MDPRGISYRFTGDNIDYEIDIYLPNGTVKISRKSSDEAILIPMDFTDMPKGKNIQIDISIAYKEKTCKDSFSKVLNNDW